MATSKQIGGDAAVLLVGGGIALWAYQSSKKAVDNLRFAISSFRLGAIHILTTELLFSLKAENPTTNPVDFTNVNFDLQLTYGGRSLARYRETRSVQVPASGSSILPVNIELNNAGVAAALLSAFQGNTPVSITVTGAITYNGIKIPVNVTKSLLA